MLCLFTTTLKIPGKETVVSIKQVINENVDAELGKFSEDKDSTREEGKEEHVDTSCACCVFISC